MLVRETVLDSGKTEPVETRTSLGTVSCRQPSRIGTNKTPKMPPTYSAAQMTR